MKVSADIAGAELEKIKNEHGGTLNAEDVVTASEAENAPLHSLFEWDDTTAARLYRIDQAKAIIRNIECVIEEIPTRAFVKAGTAGYKPIQTVLSNLDLTEILMDQARDELQAFVAKYRNLKQLAGVIDEAEEFLRKGIA